MTTMVAASGLSKRFGHLLAVDGISLTVDRGEVLGFLGPNGSGKSTTMRMITGFLAPSAGTAEICGISVLARPIDAQRRLGYLPEGAPAYADITAESYLRFIADVRGLYGASGRHAIGQAVELTDIAHVLHQPIETLSKGYKRRVGLAQAMLFIDPKVESDMSTGPGRASTSANGIRPLLESWGIRVPDGQLVGDRSMALRINAGSAARPVPADYLLWLGVPADNMAQDDPVTSQLPALNLATAGFILRDDDSPLALEPLIVSSRNSSTVDAEEVRGSRPDVLGLLNEFEPDDDTYVMAARLTGHVTTAFPNGPPPRMIEKTEGELAANPDPPQLMKSEGPVNLILVADSDLLEDRFWLRRQQFFGREVEEPIAGNADFVINALGNLAGSDELLRLRSRGVSQRPFDRVREIERQAESRLQDKERELQDKLKEAKGRIAELEGVRTVRDPVTGESRVDVSLTSEQRIEVEALRRGMLAIRKQLRAVQRGLREDVERLESWLQFANIGLVPMFVSGVAIVLAAARLARRRRNYVGTRDRAAG